MNDSLNSLTKKADPLSGKSRRPMPAWLIPAAIILGFALLFLLLFRDRILPAPKVDVAVVLSTEAQASADTPSKPYDSSYGGPTAFQASGWIEPDPLPIKATALTDGVIDKVLVLEGEDVKEGQLLATLIADDNELKLKSARSRLAMREAALKAHADAITAAQAHQEAAAAMVTQTADRNQRLEGLPKGAIAETERTAIRSAWQNAVAAESAAAAEVTRMVAQTEVFASEVAMTKVEVEIAQLASERTRITSPIDGRVMLIHAAPGKKVMMGMDDEDSATVAILYRPGKLQVRVDVPLADAAGLQVGQLARIKCNLLPDQSFNGQVSRIEGHADIARNTLQAKVRIDDPSDLLRPEMLCRVEFLESRRLPGATTSRGALSTWAPESAIRNDQVWVVDPESKRLEKRSIQAAGESRDGHLLIQEGLKPGEWVVLNPSDDLSEGKRVNPSLMKP